VPKFSILHATKRLPNGWHQAFREWCDNATLDADFEYILAIHDSDKDKLPVEMVMFEPRLHVVVNNQRDSAIDNWNAAAEMATGDVLIIGADDFYPPAGWDEQLTNFIHAQNLFVEFMLRVSTGSPHTDLPGRNMPHPIMSRALYKRWGYVFPPMYESMYSDNDNTERAELEGVVWDALHIQFRHEAAVLGKAEKDAVYRKQNREEAYRQGAAMLEQRRAANFGSPVIEEMRKLQPPPPAPIQPKHVALCLPGEWFSSAYVSHLIGLFATLMTKYRVSTTFSYCSNVYLTRGTLLDSLQKAVRAGEHIDYTLWLDDDNIVTPQQFERLMLHLDQHPELDGVMGWAWCASDHYETDPTVSCGYITDEGKLAPMSYEKMMAAPSDLINIQYSGFPVALIRMGSYEKLDTFPFRAVLDDRYTFGMAGEDLSFFIRAKQAGLNFAVDRTVRVPHYKLRDATPLVGQAKPLVEYNAA